MIFKYIRSDLKARRWQKCWDGAPEIHLLLKQPDGRRTYRFLPEEKNIVQVNPYIYDDVSIRSYLKKLKARGEDPEKYRSIWYYY